ncbi:MAG: hypothetical protein PHT78_03825 [Desulfitobacteriaceae bacterium]|nr:hypothetical protein [Desulfitobacteriaceae bacterium]MDD4752373.1 hypothetical protein [Desulfitobacteriaceae bacterium]
MKAFQFLKEKFSNQQEPQEKQEEAYAVELVEDTNNVASQEAAAGKEPLPLNDSDDELSSHLMSSVFGIVEERRKMKLMINDYKEQTSQAQNIINGILEEKKQLSEALTERENQLTAFQFQLEEQQKKYDELIEDYKSLRVNEINERKRLQQQIKELQTDYQSLNEEFHQYHETADKEAMRYKERIREEKEKFNHLQLQYNEILEENKALLEKITAFAKQISSVKTVSSIMFQKNENSNAENV